SRGASKTLLATSVPAALPSYSPPVVRAIRATGRTLRQSREQRVKRGTSAPSSMEHVMRANIRLILVSLLLTGFGLSFAAAQGAPPPGPQPVPAASKFSSNELVNSGHKFFGTVSRGLAQVIEKAISNWGLPNGYILGEEASGAFVAG